MHVRVFTRYQMRFRNRRERIKMAAYNPFVLVVAFSLIFVSMARRHEEPVCLSRFDFEEKLLQKMVRMEHAMELLQDGVTKQLTAFEEEKKTHYDYINAFRHGIKNEQNDVMAEMIEVREELRTLLKSVITEKHFLSNKPLEMLAKRVNKITSAVCPDGWVEQDDTCYLFGQVEASYTTARKYCHDNNSTLVQVDTPEENDFLKETMVQRAKDNSDFEPQLGYWNDLFETTSNGNEVWRETNTALDPNVADWFGDQPDDTSGQQTCTMFWKNFQYQWADIECDAEARNGKQDRMSDRLGRALCERPKNV